MLLIARWRKRRQQGRQLTGGKISSSVLRSQQRLEVAWRYQMYASSKRTLVAVGRNKTSFVGLKAFERDLWFAKGGPKLAMLFALGGSSSPVGGIRIARACSG